MNTNDMVMVFGSNLRGSHGGGAARYAYLHKGAMPGVGMGLKGMSYALPTIDVRMCTMSLDHIKEFVVLFLEYAARFPAVKFQVTRVACGIAGYHDVDIAPLFRDAPDNCYFDEAWKPWLEIGTMSEGGTGKQYKYWGTM